MRQELTKCCNAPLTDNSFLSICSECGSVMNDEGIYILGNCIHCGEERELEGENRNECWKCYFKTRGMNPMEAMMSYYN